jgi:oligoendopeptidase F
MLNHTGTIRDVSTMAHELGHAIHSLYANKHHYSCQHSGLPLAETASTLGELILFDKMLMTETDKKIKKQMLWEKIGDSYATILRQNYFVLFEKEAHEKIAEGITVEGLSEIYLKNLKEQFGNSVIVDRIFRYEWTYISHIFSTPFYCYAYNFGELLALSLFGKYKKEGPNFIPKIEKILAAGGSEDPVEILTKAGFEVTKEEFWQESFKIVKDWTKQLKNL